MSISGHDSWYQVVRGTDVQQGDLFDNFPVVVLKETMPINLDELEITEGYAEVRVVNVIVMTQSCDFQKLKDDDIVTLCPRQSFNILYEGKDNAALKDAWKRLRQGHIISAHLLNECTIPDLELPIKL